MLQRGCSLRRRPSGWGRSGVYPSVEDACDRTISTTDAVEPGDNVPYYADFFPRYRNLYPALRFEFEQMADTLQTQSEGRFYTVD